MQQIITTISNVATFIGLIIIGLGGLSSIVFVIFKAFAEKWLDSRFTKQLEQLRHAQQTEMESTRLKLNSLMDRRLKLHSMEFDVLPETWSKLVDACGIVSSVVSPLQTYPDLGRMESPQLEAFLGRSELLEWQKDELRRSADRNSLYSGYSDWTGISKSYKAYGDFYSFLRKNLIFIREPMKTQFIEISTLISDALFEYRLSREHRDFAKQEHTVSLQRFMKEGHSLLNALEIEIRGRLWDALEDSA
jgi:hypothetical protein